MEYHLDTDASELIRLVGSQARLLNLTSKGVAAIPWPRLEYSALAVAYAPDGNYLALNDNKEVRMWDLKNKKVTLQANSLFDSPVLPSPARRMVDGSRAVTLRHLFDA